MAVEIGEISEGATNCGKGGEKCSWSSPGMIIDRRASRGGLDWIQATPKINNQRGNQIMVAVDRE